MARDIICDVCQAVVATWLEGNLKTGEQTGLCDGCWIAWTLGRLDAELGPDAKAAIAARWAPQGGPGDAEGTGEGSEPKSARRRPGRAPERVATDQAAAEGARAAQAALEAGEVEPNRRLAEAPAAADDG